MDNKRRIGIDFDGTLADTMLLRKVWLRRHNHVFPEHLLLTRTFLEDKISKQLYAQMQEETGFADTLDCHPMEECIEVIEQLYTTYDFIVITSRSANKIHWVKTWLEKHSIRDYFKEIYSAKEKVKLEVAKHCACDCLIDNDIRHLMPKGYPEIRKILLNPAIETNINIEAFVQARSWMAIKDNLLVK